MKQSGYAGEDAGVDECLGSLLLVCRHYDGESGAGKLGRQGSQALSERTLMGIAGFAERVGFRTRIVRLTFRQLQKYGRFPCILRYNGRFVVMFQNFYDGRRKMVSLQSWTEGTIRVQEVEFVRLWGTERKDAKEVKGSALLLEPTFRFYAPQESAGNRLNWRTALQYIRNKKWHVAGVFLAFLLSSFIQLLFPFLMQCIVDIGIGSRDLSFVAVVLVAQLILLISRLGVDFIRSYLLYQVSRIINLAILSDFWIKLSHLPFSYGERYHTGDIMQRLDDNRNLRVFFTGQLINTFFSAVNFLVFSIVLIFYDVTVFLIFLAGVVGYVFWMRSFFPVRRKLNSAIFRSSTEENNATLQFINGMHEIKLQNIQQLKRWEWEDIHINIFRLNFKSLIYTRIEDAGTLLISQGKDIILTFLVAKLVIDGKITIGAMFAIQYILGQLSNPIELFLNFIQAAQDAKISMERLNEIHQIEAEEPVSAAFVRQLPAGRTIRIENLRFAYPGSEDTVILDNIDLRIPAGKTTAIVGASGSGKTTLLKVLLRYYDSYEGNIKVGDCDLKQISPGYWRDQCGAVMQDGFIFNDSIGRNISLGREPVDDKKLQEACRLANILPFIEGLPEGLDTRLGIGGVGISQGQRQRILIARLIYKDPEYLFFDEFTNALDANNEKIIIENLQAIFRNRTVVVVAHRLSTVRNADEIVVMQGGRIMERGSHDELIRCNGGYLELIKNQLDIRN